MSVGSTQRHALQLTTQMHCGFHAICTGRVSARNASNSSKLSLPYNVTTKDVTWWHPISLETLFLMKIHLRKKTWNAFLFLELKSCFKKCFSCSQVPHAQTRRCQGHNNLTNCFLSPLCLSPDGAEKYLKWAACPLARHCVDDCGFLQVDEAAMGRLSVP